MAGILRVKLATELLVIAWTMMKKKEMFAYERLTNGCMSSDSAGVALGTTLRRDLVRDNLGLSLESRNLDKGCLTAVHQHVAYP